MTLAELRAKYPALFHPNQDWFEGEAFMDRAALIAPSPLFHAGPPPQILPSAATLALCYVNERQFREAVGSSRPTSDIWKHYLWTSDLDQFGQQVYVGDNGKGFEIHRHLHLTERWGYPVWA